MSKWTILAAAVAMTTSAFAASNPFSDVGRTHWAYAAIQRAVDAGILQGFDGKFHGDKLVNRYQMAVIIKKILDTVDTKGGPAAAGMAPADIQNLEQLTIEFADELALLNVKVSTLEDSFTELRNQVDNMKQGGGRAAGPAIGIGNAFTGFVAVALAATDNGNAGATPDPNSLGNLTRWTPTTADQTFFTIPQASIALDTEVGDGIGLHVQYDYSTDAPNAVGGGVGLNEAYLFVDELFGDIGGKIGGFALPYQSWEINGAFRSSDMTITPSVKNTFIERARVVGLDITKTKDVDPADFKWNFLLFNAGDVAVNAGSPNAFVGALADGTGLGALTGTATVDDSFGFGINLESGDDPDKSWGWRLGWCDLGGDISAVPAVAPIGGNPAGLANSEEIDFWQLGFWWKNDNFKVVLEYMDGSNDFAQGAGGSMDINAWYLLVNFKMNDKTTLSLRYDDFENEINSVPAASGGEGDAITFAWNRRISDTSMFQFEYVAPDSDVIPTTAGLNGDFDDDLIQFRYKVWF